MAGPLPCPIRRAARHKALEKLRGIAELEDESAVVPILIDAILLAESDRGARHQITFLDDLTGSVDGLLRELTIVERSRSAGPRNRGKPEQLPVIALLTGLIPELQTG